jgi:hypothetical protein
VFGRQPEQFGQGFVEVVAAGNGSSRRREKLAIGSFVKWSFARHQFLPMYTARFAPAAIVRQGPRTATPHVFD